MARLRDVCRKGSSNIAQKELEGHDGEFPIYGAGGFISNVDFYQQEQPYIAVVKDGAGIGRVMKLPAKSSVIGTMQYILPNPNVDLSYLAFAMEHMDLAKYYSGATIPHIYFKDYQEEELSLPTMEKQIQISAVLDKVTDLISLRKQQLAKLDELVKARFLEMFGDPYINPKEWPVVSLGDLFEVGSSKRIYQNEMASEGVPFLRISDLTEKISSGVCTAELFIPEARYDSLKRAGLVPKPGDILITSRGTLGHCYVITDKDKFYFQDGMISWLSNMDNKITTAYIIQLFQMSGFRREIDEVPAGTTVNYLSLAKLKQLSVMLPDIDLQLKFSAFVREINPKKLTIQQSLDKLKTLRKSLMQKYFG